jgi:hypothetical protein
MRGREREVTNSAISAAGVYVEDSLVRVVVVRGRVAKDPQ